MVRLGNGIAKRKLACAAALALLWSGMAPAATFTVNSTLHGTDSNPATTTLVEAINAANGAAGSDTIVLPSQSLFQVDDAVSVVLDSTGRTLYPRVTGPTLIQGNGSTIDFLSAPTSRNARFFVVASGASLELEDLSLIGGRLRGGDGVQGNFGNGGGGAAMGGAIYVDGATASLTLRRSTIAACSATGGSAGLGVGAIGGSGGAGGGMGSVGSGGAGGVQPGSAGSGGFGQGGGGAWINPPNGGAAGAGGFGGGGGGANSTATRGLGGAFGGNGGGYNGGGLAGGGGGAGLGGAIFNLNGTVTLENTTLTANSAQGGATDADALANGHTPGTGAGAAIFNYDGVMTLRHVTVHANQLTRGFAPDTAIDGGAVANYNAAGGGAPSLTLYNSVLNGTTDGTGSTPTFDLVNYAGGTVTAGGTASTNWVSSSSGTITGTVRSGALTMGTIARTNGILLVYPAASLIDSGDGGNSLPTDARGAPRPSGGAVDVGAVEGAFAATVSVQTGDLLVTEGSNDAVYAISPANGRRSLLSKSGVRGSGPAITNPVDVTVDSNQNIYVLDATFQGVIQIDRNTGDRTVVSIGPTDATTAGVTARGSGPEFSSPTSIAVVGAGQLAVTDSGSSAGLFSDAVFLIDVATGNRTVLSDDTVPNATNAMTTPVSMINHSTLGILVADSTTNDAVLRVANPGGGRTVFSSSALTVPDAVNPFTSPAGLAEDSDGSVLLIDTTSDQLLRLSTSNGARTVVTNLVAADSYNGVEGTAAADYVNKTNTPDAVLRVTGASFTPLSSNLTGDGPIFGTAVGTVTLGLGLAIVPGPSSVAPTVSSPTSASITESAAVLGGSVDSDGGAAVSVRGIVLAPTATNNNPQLGGPGVINLTTTGTTGVYTLNATGLSSNTQYSFKAYATNSSGTGYSNVATFTTLRSANLAITKSDGTTVEVPGTTVTYTILASNAGPDATNATVTDTLPAGLTACSYTCVGAGGGSCPASGSGNISASVSLPAAASVTFTLNCTIPPGAIGSLSNTASIAPAAGTVDPVSANDSATDVDTLAPTGDLAITKTNGTGSVVAGASTSYNITVSNPGPSTAVAVNVSDSFPPACSFVGWTCSGSGGGVCSSLGSGNINQSVSLPPGGSTTFSASCTVSAGSAGGTLSNTATITAPGGFSDPNSANNSATDGPDSIGCPATLVTSSADSGAGSLRQIVADACAGSTITFLPSLTQVNLSSGEIVLNKNLTIQGSGQRVDSNNTSRLFRVDAGVSVAMSDLTLARGNGVSPVQSGQGSAVLLLGSLSMDRITVRDNGASAVRVGGACSINGSAEFLDLRNSLFANNGDAALFVNCGVAIVRNSTFTGTATSGNPAVAQNFGRTLLIQSTVAGNAGRGIGTATYSYGTLVANNAAGDLFSSGIYLSGGSNLYGTLTGSTIRGVTDGNVSNVAAGLAPLGSYGGSTDTLALLPGSVAINGVVNRPEVQLIVRDETDTASYTLTFNGQTTAPLNSPNEATLQAALEALPNIGAGNVDVIGTGSGFPIAVAVVQFTGALANTNQPLIVSSRPGVLVRPVLDGGTLTATDQRGIARAQGAEADIGAYESRGFNRTLTGGSSQSAALNSAFASPLSLTVTAAASGEPVSNGSVSYSAPGSGPSASLAPATATLSAGGVASSGATANGTLGSYNVTADFRGNLDGPLSFALTNRAPAADLSVGKSNGVNGIVPGTGTTYTIVVFNAGPDATNANVVDNLPPQLASCNWTCAPSGGASCNASGSGSINETLVMPASSSASFTLNCSVPASATGSVANSVSVTGTNPDPATINNTAFDNDPLTPQADLVVSKSDGRTTVEAGTSTSYSIQVTNAGPSNAPAASVIDVLPPACGGVTWTCAGSSGGSCASSGAGNIAETVVLPAGGSVQFAVICVVASAATVNLVNTAQAAPTGGVIDTVASNNSSTDTNTIIAQPQLSVVPVSASFVEGTPAVFRLQLSAPALSTGVSGTVSTSDGTAQSPSDYSPLTTQPFTIPAGQSFVDVPVSTINDSTVEGPETLTLTVVGTLQGAQPGPLAAAATLTDNDSAQINFSAATYSASEGAAQISLQVTTTAAVQSGVSVTLNSTNGTAGPADYTPVVNGSVSFPANSTAPQTLTIPINNDLLDEDDETFTVTLSGPSGAVGNVSIGTGNSALVTILDDDALPVLSISSPSQPEGNSGQTPMNFVITLTPVSGRAVSFTRSTVDGSATVASNDYVALAAQTVSIPAGQTTLTVPVQIVGDSVYEGDQSFALNLSSVVNATPASVSGTGTIQEDDQQPTTTTISSDTPDPSVVGQPYLVSVNVSAQTASPVGSVQISDGSATCTATLSAATSPNSTGSCTLTSTTAGAKTLTATYTPSSAVFAGSSGTTAHQVNAAATTLTVSGPARSRINQPTTFSVALAVVSPGVGTPTGTVTLTSGASSCTVTLPATGCALSFNALGSRSVTASYGGDANFAASSASGPGNAQTLVYALSDIAVSKTDALSIYQSGDLLVYTVTVRNLGPDAAAQIRVRDDIPAGLINAVWSCDAAGGVSCPVVGGSGSLDTTVGSFPVGGVLNFTFYGNASSGQEISNTALVVLPLDTTIDDPASGNNSATDVNRNDLIFRDGLEDPPINAPSGSFRVPGLALRSVLDEVAVPVLELRDTRGLALRLYARQWNGEMQYALALRGGDGLLRLGAWQTLPGEPVLGWTAARSGNGWLLEGASLR